MDPPDVFDRDRVYTSNCLPVQPNLIPIPHDFTSFVKRLPTTLVACTDILRQYKTWLLSAERNNDSPTINAILGIIFHLRFSYCILSKAADSESQLFVRQYKQRFPALVDEYSRRLESLSPTDGDDKESADLELSVSVTSSNHSDPDDSSVETSAPDNTCDVQKTSESRPQDLRSLDEPLPLLHRRSRRKRAPNKLCRREANDDTSVRPASYNDDSVVSKRQQSKLLDRATSKRQHLRREKGNSRRKKSCVNVSASVSRPSADKIHDDDFVSFVCSKDYDMHADLLTAFDGEIIIRDGIYVKRKKFVSFQPVSEVPISIRNFLNQFEEFEENTDSMIVRSLNF